MNTKFISLGLFFCWVLVAQTAHGQALPTNILSDSNLPRVTGPLPGPITLTNTPAAPLDARGVAEFGKPAGAPGAPVVLAIETQGLGAGKYKVLAVSRTDGSRVLLGLLQLQDPTLSPDKETGGNKRQDSAAHPSEPLLSRTELPLPLTLVSTDIDQIVVADLGGNDLLAGSARALLATGVARSSP